MTGKGQLQMYFKMSLGQFETLLQTLALNLKKESSTNMGTAVLEVLRSL